MAWGIAEIRLSSVSARYSVPLGASATPVGPIASAVGSSRHGIALAITVWLSTLGGCPAPELSWIRSTVEFLIVCRPFLAPPLRTMLTNRVVVDPWVAAVMSHGPWMFAPAIVLSGWPLESSTIRQPQRAGAA